MRKTTLLDIHDWIEKEAEFTSLKPQAPLVCGFVGLIAALAQLWLGWTFHDPEKAQRALLLWMATCGIALPLYVLVNFRMLRPKRLIARVQRMRRPEQFAHAQLMLTLSLGLLVTLAIWKAGHESLVVVPTFWLGFYALAMFSISFVSPKPFRRLYFFCLIAAAASVFAPEYDAIWLGLGFGLGHLAQAAAVFRHQRYQSENPPDA